MKKLTALLFVVFLLSLMLYAQKKSKNQKEPILWNGLRHGMTLEQVKKKYPDIGCLDDKTFCRVPVPLKFDGFRYTVWLGFDPKLNRVDILSDHSSDTADESSESYQDVKDAYYKLFWILKEKYGQRDAEGNDVKAVNNCVDVCVWLHKGVFIRLEIKKGSDDNFYRAVVEYWKDTRKENADLL